MIWRYDDRFGYPAWCDLEMHERPDGKRVFVVTEIVHNPGRCITNNPVKLANEVKQHYALRPKDMVWVERYPQRPQCGMSAEWLTECFELILLSANRRGQFTNAESQRLNLSQVEDLISGRIVVSQIFPANGRDQHTRFRVSA